MVGLVKAMLPGHLVDDKPLDGRSHENKTAGFLAAAARNAPGIIQGHGVRDYISVAGHGPPGLFSRAYRNTVKTLLIPLAIRSEML